MGWVAAPVVWPPFPVVIIPETADNLLLEDGDDLLLEDGGLMLLE